MSEVVSRIPFDRSAGTYLKEWQPTQDEQVSWIRKVFNRLILTSLSLTARTRTMTV